MNKTFYISQIDTKYPLNELNHMQTDNVLVSWQSRCPWQNNHILTTPDILGHLRKYNQLNFNLVILIKQLHFIAVCIYYIT